jgi:hypothetical protein
MCDGLGNFTVLEIGHKNLLCGHVNRESGWSSLVHRHSDIEFFNIDCVYAMLFVHLTEMSVCSLWIG